MFSFFMFLIGFGCGAFFVRWLQKFSKRDLADQASKAAKLASTMALIRLLENRT